jgi:stress response protein SCP2
MEISRRGGPDLYVGLGWQSGQKPIDLDLSVLVMRGNEVHQVLCHGNNTYRGTAISLSPDDRKGGDYGDSEWTWVDIDCLSQDDDRLVFVVTSSQGCCLGNVPSATCRLGTFHEETFMTVYVTRFSGMQGSGLLFAEIKRNFSSQGWAYNTIGLNVSDGLCASGKTMRAAVAQYCTRTPIFRPYQVAYIPFDFW